MSDRSASDVSRRQFLVRSSAAMAAAIAAGYFISPSRAEDTAAQAPGGRKLGFAFVGIGMLAMGQLLPEIVHCKYARPVALVSGHPDKARQQADKYGIDPKRIYNYDNFDSIKDNPEIDVVYIVLPNSMHAEYVTRAAKAGKHVMCEKPMATSVAEGQQMIDACNQAGKKLQIGYRLRYEPNTMRLIDSMRKQECGKLQIIEAGAGFTIGDPKQWRLHKKLSGGGCLMDIGIYALNASRYISGEEPVEVSAMTYGDTSDERFKEVEQHCNFQLRFPSNALASCSSSYNTGLNRFRAHCTKGWAEVDPALSYHGVKFRQDRGRGLEQPEIPDIFQFAAEMDAFCEAIAKTETPRTPGEEGLKDLKVIEAIYKAAATGQTVKV